MKQDASIALHSLHLMTEELMKICNLLRTILQKVQAMEFYLDINSIKNYEELIKNLRTLFKSGESFCLLVGDFYNHFQHPWETEDQFADEL